MRAQDYHLPEGVIEQVWLATGKPAPRFRSDGKASVRCIFPDRHNHGDRQPSAYLDRGRNIYGCHCLDRPLTAKQLAAQLGVDWQGIRDQVLPSLPMSRPDRARKGEMVNNKGSTIEDVMRSLRVAKKYTQGKEGKDDPAQRYLWERGLQRALEDGSVTVLHPDGEGLPKAVAFQARKDFRIAAPTYSLTTGDQAALVLRSLSKANGRDDKVRTCGSTSGTAFCNEAALRLIRGEDGAPKQVLLLEGMTDYLAGSVSLPQAGWALIGFPGVGTASTFFVSENGTPPAPWIEGRSFFFAFDQDDAGKKTTARVVEALGKYPGVRLYQVKWPDGLKDAAQLLKRQGPEALVTAVESADEIPTQRMRFVSAAASGGELLAAEITRPESLVGEGLMTKGTLALLFGRPGVSKTWAALQLAYALVTGRGRWFGLPTGQNRVGYLSLELPAFHLQQRLRAISSERGTLTDLRLVCRPCLRGAVDLEQDDTVALIEWCKRDSLALLILDPLSRLHRADENSAQEMAGVLSNLERLCEETGTAVLLVHHERKVSSGGRNSGTGRSELDLLRGSSRLQSDPTLIMHLAEYRGSVRLSFPKPNLALEPKPVYLVRTHDGPLTLGEEPLDASTEKAKRKQALAEFLAVHQGEEFATKELLIQTDLGVQERTLRKYLEELADEGRVIPCGTNKDRRWTAASDSVEDQNEQRPFEGQAC